MREPELRYVNCPDTRHGHRMADWQWGDASATDVGGLDRFRTPYARAMDGVVAPYVLAPEAAHAMTQRGARASLVEFPGIGHAPTLVAPDQLDGVVDFVLA